MSNLLTFILLSFASSVYAQCDTNALIVDQIRASDTDSNIPFEAARHNTFFNPDCTPRNILLVYLVGSYAAPYQSVLFPSHAANNGFHVLSLKYINNVAAQTPCGPSTDIDCHYKFRKEIIDGEDLSTETSVDSVNSIQNRLIRLLQYMDSNNPTQNWGQFFTGDSIHWNQVMLSGHSQGGGHAAVMAIERPVNRVIMFASPNDYSNNFSQVANWTTMPHTTQDSAYFSFNNLNDQVVDYNWQYTAAQNIGVAGDTALVDNDDCPYETSHNLYTALEFVTFGSNHGSVVYDSNVPLDGNGEPLYKDVWSYLLGIDCLPLEIIENEMSFELYPNPAASNLSVKSEMSINRFEISNVLGELVLMDQVEAKEFTIDLSSLAPGTYLLQCTTESGIIQKRILKN